MLGEGRSQTRIDEYGAMLGEGRSQIRIDKYGAMLVEGRSQTRKRLEAYFILRESELEKGLRRGTPWSVP